MPAQRRVRCRMCRPRSAPRSPIWPWGVQIARTPWRISLGTRRRLNPTFLGAVHVLTGFGAPAGALPIPRPYPFHKSTSNHGMHEHLEHTELSAHHPLVAPQTVGQTDSIGEDPLRVDPPATSMGTTSGQ